VERGYGGRGGEGKPEMKFIVPMQFLSLILGGFGGKY
jgi:hypothetical protein